MLNDNLERNFSMVPFGLLSLSIAVLLMGLAAIFPSSTVTAPYFTMALLFGGIGEGMAGIWAFANRESVVGTAFSSLGLFFLWFSLTHLLLLDGGIETMADLAGFSMGIVFLVGGALSLYIWLLCSNQSSGLRLTLLFLWLSLLVMAASLFTTLNFLLMVGGILALASATIAAIASFTELHQQAGLGELPSVDQLAKRAGEGIVERVGPVDELTRKARRTLAEKIRPNDSNETLAGGIRPNDSNEAPNAPNGPTFNEREQ